MNEVLRLAGGHWDGWVGRMAAKSANRRRSCPKSLSTRSQNPTDHHCLFLGTRIVATLVCASPRTLALASHKIEEFKIASDSLERAQGCQCQLQLMLLLMPASSKKMLGSLGSLRISTHHRQPEHVLCLVCTLKEIQNSNTLTIKLAVKVSSDYYNPLYLK